MIKLKDLLIEGLDLKKLEAAIKDFQKKIAKQGRVTNARDEQHLEQLIKVYKQMGGKKIKEGKLTEVSAGVNVFYFYKKAKKDKNKFFKMLSDFRKKHSDTKWMKMLNYALEDFNENPKKYKTIDDKQNKLFKNLQQNKKVYEQKLREQIREIIKEQLNEQKFKKVILPNDMKTKVKVSKMIKQLKLKIDKDYDVKALKARGGDQVISILPKHYNKFIELAMKNKLNPRG